MRIGRKARRLVALSVLVAVALVGSVGAIAAPPAVTPKGDEAMLVFMANGTYNPHQPPPVPTSGNYFDSVVMHRTHAEKEARLQGSLGFFEERFGLTFDLFEAPVPIVGGDLVGFLEDPDEEDGVNRQVFLLHSYMDTRWNYRAHSISGEGVRPRGRKVHQAEYSVVVADPDGILVEGTWGGQNGIHVGPATVMSDGEYLIEHPKRDAQDVLLAFETPNPLFDQFDADGTVFDYTVHSSEWGDGHVFGRRLTRSVQGTNDIQQLVRTVINFPAPVSLR